MPKATGQGKSFPSSWTGWPAISCWSTVETSGGGFFVGWPGSRLDKHDGRDPQQLSGLRHISSFLPPRPAMTLATTQAADVDHDRNNQNHKVNAR